MDKGIGRVPKINTQFRWGVALTVLTILCSVVYTVVDIALVIIKLFSHE